MSCIVTADSLRTGTHLSSWPKPMNPWQCDQSRETSSSTESTNEIQGPAWQYPGFHLSWSLRETDWRIKEVTGGFETQFWKNFPGLFTVWLLLYSAFLAFRFLVPSFSSSFDLAGGGGGWETSWEAPWWSWWWLLCPLETEPKKTGQMKFSIGAKGEAWEWVAVMKTCHAKVNTQRSHTSAMKY